MKLLQFSCSGCDQHFEAPAEMIGDTITCPACRKQQQVLGVCDKCGAPTLAKYAYTAYGRESLIPNLSEDMGYEGRIERAVNPDLILLHAVGYVCDQCVSKEADTWEKQNHQFNLVWYSGASAVGLIAALVIGLIAGNMSSGLGAGFFVLILAAAVKGTSDFNPDEVLGAHGIAAECNQDRLQQLGFYGAGNPRFIGFDTIGAFEQELKRQSLS